MESAAAEKALQGAITMSEANDPWHVAQVLPSGPVQASHTWGSMDAIPPGGVHYTAGGFSAPAQSQFGGRALPPVEDLTLGELISSSLNNTGPLPLLTEAELHDLMYN